MRLILTRIDWTFDMRLTDESHGFVENRKVHYLRWGKAPMRVHPTPIITSNDS